MKREPIKLSLLENSHAFLREAIANAIEADTNPHRWQFAILHLVQSVELSLKAALEKVHPVLIFDDLDAAKSTTVNPRQAIRRLEDPRMGDMTFSQKDRERVDDAIKIRNQVTHQHFELKPEVAAAKFFALLPFALHFQEKYLHTKVTDVVSEEHMKGLRLIRKALKELVQAALRRIKDEGIETTHLWACPSCEQATFVIKDGQDTCYTCRHSAKVAECPSCFETVFASTIHVVKDDFTDHEWVVCSSCVRSLEDEREREWWERHRHEDLMDEFEDPMFSQD